MERLSAGMSCRFRLALRSLPETKNELLGMVGWWECGCWGISMESKSLVLARHWPRSQP